MIDDKKETYFAGKDGIVIQWSSDDKNLNRQWKVTALPNGNYIFTNVATGYNLGFPDAGLVGEPVFQLKADGSNRNQMKSIICLLFVIFRKIVCFFSYFCALES